MNNKIQSHRISSKKLRAILNDFTEEICSLQDILTIAFSGNTLEIHFGVESINITVNEEGGDQ